MIFQKAIGANRKERRRVQKKRRGYTKSTKPKR